MDMARTRDLDSYLERLRELPFVRAARVEAARASTGRSSAEAALVIKTPQGTRRCPVEVRASHLSREVAERVVDLHHDRPDLMLLAPHVGRELGDRFTRAGVNFIDLAGNCHVRFDDAYVARIQGQSAPAAPAEGRGFRAPSYAALLALLIDPELITESTRAIAAAAGNISPQTAADLRARLVARGDVLAVRGRHRWSPTGRRRALDLLLGGWSSTLIPHALIGRYRARERDLSTLEARLARELDAVGPWRWGGGAAAQRLTGYYRGDDTVIYLADPPTDLTRRLALVPDREGPVVLLRVPCPSAFEGPQTDTVNPLLVYADLLAEGEDRAREAAHEVRARYLGDLEVGA